MIKGIAKHVVVVKAPDPDIFEEAIFVVKDSYLARAKGSRHEVMRTAELAAQQYIKENPDLARKNSKKGVFPWRQTATRIAGRERDE